MIHIGLDDGSKLTVLEQYIREHNINKVYVLSPERLAPAFANTKVSHPDEVDGRRGYFIAWPDHIQYRYYYRLIASADERTLLVLNEVLRGHHRTALNYNCVRTFLQTIQHKLVFQHLPIVDSIDEVMTLIDFENQSRWWSEKFSRSMLREVRINIEPAKPLTLEPIRVPVDDRVRAAYEKEKASLLRTVREDYDKDPHLIPRNLVLVSGKAKLPLVDPKRRYVSRNNRFGLDNIETYRNPERDQKLERTLLELPHGFVDMADFIAASRQRHLPVMVADTKAEDWYLSRFQAWVGRVNDAHVALNG